VETLYSEWAMTASLRAIIEFSWSDFRITFRSPRNFRNLVTTLTEDGVTPFAGTTLAATT